MGVEVAKYAYQNMVVTIGIRAKSTHKSEKTIDIDNIATKLVQSGQIIGLEDTFSIQRKSLTAFAPWKLDYKKFIRKSKELMS